MIDNERAWVEINLDNFKHNIINIKENIGSHTKLLTVLKADGYGHGAVELAKTFDEVQVDYIGVAVYEEAFELRKNNIKIPILVLGHTPKINLKNIIEYNISQTIYNYDLAKEISEIAVKLNKIAHIHIKIDTGMHRIGFDTTRKSLYEIKEISKLENINIQGIYTHFSQADTKDKTYTNIQLQTFNNFISNLNIKTLIHSANSAATLDFKLTHMDMVRSGIIIYGIEPSSEIDTSKLDLKPVLSFKTRVINIQKVKKGSYIGYGDSYKANDDMVIATVSLGYADGYFRMLSNKGNVLVKGIKVDIVGNICMDQFMIDVTNIENITYNDIVTLIGKDDDNEITAKQLADIIGTIPYEVVCNINKRVSRVYIENNQFKKIIKYEGFR